MWIPQILVCAVAILGGECRPATATDQWYAETATSPAVCLQHGEFSAAQYPESLLVDSYVKIRCLRPAPGKVG